MAGKAWQAGEIAYLRDHINDMTNDELAAQLGRSSKAIRLFCQRARIIRTPEALARNASRRWQGENNPNWQGGVTYDLAAYARGQKQKHLEHVRARRKVEQALRSGRMIRGACEVCNGKNAEAHHPDYERPLAVRWLCRRHHREIHNEE